MNNSNDMLPVNKHDLDSSYSTEDSDEDDGSLSTHLISDYNKVLNSNLDREFDRMFSSGFEPC